ncbi:hypothetical protein CPT_Stills60 [Bacillus phage Stills]|uniref:Uncharacterized protein n=1 Tax=Bacillus phage Stills TaxID=1610833 RepID=A0A0E3X9J2_9CAUD|nr:hypothetical protein CPT_Stills60 [Bacillus phage Stills]AKC02688.1 hypothetical protein CPT_Stills60 [Bacillus phage Stills]
MEQKELSRKEIIDGLLDVYNDYMELFKIFGDKEYLEVTEVVLRHLKKITAGQALAL